MSWKIITRIAKEQIILQLAKREKENPSAKNESPTTLHLVPLNFLVYVKFVFFYDTMVKKNEKAPKEVKIFYFWLYNNEITGRGFKILKIHQITDDQEVAYFNLWHNHRHTGGFDLYTVPIEAYTC